MTTTCPHCKGTIYRCDDCDRHLREIAGMADELAFWKYQAVWHRVYSSGVAKPENDKAAWKQADAQLEKARVQENRERYAHAEAPREIGS